MDHARHAHRVWPAVPSAAGTAAPAPGAHDTPPWLRTRTPVTAGSHEPHALSLHVRRGFLVPALSRALAHVASPLQHNSGSTSGDAAAHVASAHMQAAAGRVVSWR